MPIKQTASPTLCPSAQPHQEGSFVFGVVCGTQENPRIGWLETPLPASRELLSSSAPVRPTEVFRFAAPCAEDKCVHFHAERCRLASQLVTMLSPVVDRLPPCALRVTCRWWCQEGPEACSRCPQVVTEQYRPTGGDTHSEPVSA